MPFCAKLEAPKRENIGNLKVTSVLFYLANEIFVYFMCLRLELTYCTSILFENKFHSDSHIYSLSRSEDHGQQKGY